MTHPSHQNQHTELPTSRWRVPDDELRQRISRLQQHLQRGQVSAAVLTQTTSVFYLAGSICNGWLVVPAEGEPQLHLRRAVERTKLETCWPVQRTVSTRQLVRELERLGIDRRRIGCELDVTPAADHLKLLAALDVPAVSDISHELRSVRAVKSAWELRQIHAAAQQVALAMPEVAAQVEPGMREIDVFMHAERVLRREGHQGQMRMRRIGGEMFFGQVAAGWNAAVPAALDAPLGGSGLYPAVGKGASDRLLERGELLVLDLMGACNGYLSDCTRVVAVGGVDAVDDELLEAQQWCVDVLAQVASRGGPGVAGSALYEHALELAQAGGHAQRFMGAAPDQARFVGHGIGLEVDEYPFLAPGYDAPLEPGMVFALEPKLVFAGRAAVGIEDAFVVTQGGVEPLQAPPRDVMRGRG